MNFSNYDLSDLNRMSREKIKCDKCVKEMIKKKIRIKHTYKPTKTFLKVSNVSTTLIREGECHFHGKFTHNIIL